MKTFRLTGCMCQKVKPMIKGCKDFDEQHFSFSPQRHQNTFQHMAVVKKYEVPFRFLQKKKEVFFLDVNKKNCGKYFLEKGQKVLQFVSKHLIVSSSHWCRNINLGQKKGFVFQFQKCYQRKKTFFVFDF